LINEPGVIDFITVYHDVCDFVLVSCLQWIESNRLVCGTESNRIVFFFAESPITTGNKKTILLLNVLASPAMGHCGMCHPALDFRLIFWSLQSRTNSLSLDCTWLLT